MSQVYPKVYAVWHVDENIRIASQSGGAFTAISDRTLKNDGVVYGCVLDSKFQAVHIRATDEDTRNRMRGSKYIQSRLSDTFKAVRTDLAAGKDVLFSGTSCQVAGLKKYLGKEYENLLCVDIVCHGVPSPVVWKRYLEWQQVRKKGELIGVNFRNKKDFGWHSHYETLYFNDGRKISSKVFSTIFYDHAALRPCCYECPFKSTVHPGDITIADYWGIKNVAPEFDDNRGVSLVLINSEIGTEIFDEVKNRVIWKRTRIEDSMQRPLIGPFPKPEHREQFWTDLKNEKFAFIAKKYGKDKLKSKVKVQLILLKNSITQGFRAR